MKLGIFTELYQRGGIDTFIINLMNAWPEQDSLALIANTSYPAIDAIAAQVMRPLDIVQYTAAADPALARVGGFSRILRRVASPATRYTQLIADAVGLRGMLHSVGLDALMIVNGGYPGADKCRAAALAWRMGGVGKQSVHNFHNLAAPIPWYLRVQETAIDLAVGAVTHRFVTVSRAAAASISARPAIDRLRRTSYIYNGIVVSKPRQTRHDVRARLGLSDSAPLVLMLGTYEERKGHRFLFEALVKIRLDVPDVQLVVCGFGFPHEIARVEQLRRDMRLENHVQLLGFQSNTADLFAAADVLAIASQEYESFGLTAIEAMAHRVPVVSTDVGGLPEVIANGNGGYTVRRDDVAGYAQRIVMLLKDEELRRAQAVLGAERYLANFTAVAMARQYADLIHRMNTMDSQGSTRDSTSVANA